MENLPRTDSPLTKVFLGQYLSSLILETLTYLKMSHKELAQALSMPEIVFRDAVHGNLGLTRRQWVRLGELLGLSTAFDLLPGQKNGAPCWELCDLPIPLRRD